MSVGVLVFFVVCGYFVMNAEGRRAHVHEILHETDAER